MLLLLLPAVSCQSPAPLSAPLPSELPAQTSTAALSPTTAAGATLRLGTATVGGVWNPLGIALAELISKNIPGVTAAALTTGGAVDNLKLLTTGQLELALADESQVARINAGRLPNVSAEAKPVRIIMGLYEQPLHIVARADAGITGLADLKGRRISTGAEGSSTEEQAGYVLKALGLDWDQDITRQKLSLADSAAALKSGQLDAFFWSGAVPSETAPTRLSDLAADPGLKLVFLSIQGGLAEKISSANPAVFHRTVIKKGEYANLNADVETLAITAVLTTLDTFPPAQLTALLEAVFDHKTELTSVWKGAATLTAPKSLGVLSADTRQYLHPAAAAFFEKQQPVLYQVSTYSLYTAGNFDGVATLADLKQKGSLGLGALDALEGELIMLDGQAYRAKSNGVIEELADSVKTPFAKVVAFAPEGSPQELGALENLDALKAALDQRIVHQDSFYAFRITGTFTRLQLRTLSKQNKPYPELATVYKNEPAFELENVKGTLVGTWLPASMGNVAVAGYDLHFISDDRTRGGHVLEASLADAQVSLAELRKFQIELGPLTAGK